jgi:hypothetical protein
MGQIFPYLFTFEPHDLMAISMAFDDVCKALKLANNNKAREIIAERIIELAQHGECSPTKLRDRVLAESAAR